MNSFQGNELSQPLDKGTSRFPRTALRGKALLPGIWSQSPKGTDRLPAVLKTAGMLEMQGWPCCVWSTEE